MYKYISNGNLYDWLHAAKRRTKVLEWPSRIKIAIGIVRGLAWLHHASSSDLYNVIDESLIGRGSEDEIFELLRIAYTCLNLFPGQRPMMLELHNTIRIFGERDRLTSNSETLRY